MAEIAGTRNEGKEMEGAEAIALSNPFNLAVESIADRLQASNMHWFNIFCEIYFCLRQYRKSVGLHVIP